MITIPTMTMPRMCAECDLENCEEDRWGQALSYNCPLLYKGYTNKFRKIGRLPDCPLQEPIHAHWIEYENDSLIRGKCSNCQWEAHLYEDDVVGMPYCPNCGAKMTNEE